MRRSAASTRSTSSSNWPARFERLRSRAAEQAGLKGQQLAAGLPRVKAGLLQRHTDAAPRLVRIGGDVDAGHPGPSRR